MGLCLDLSFVPLFQNSVLFNVFFLTRVSAIVVYYRDILFHLTSYLSGSLQSICKVDSQVDYMLPIIVVIPVNVVSTEAEKPPSVVTDSDDDSRRQRYLK